jgi:LPS-assembly lipoprotein
MKRRGVMWSAVCLLGLMLAGCGFQLRGAATPAALPASISTLRLTMPGRIAYPPLLVAVRDALRLQPGVTLTDSAGVPTLVLLGEEFTVNVLAIDATGKVSDYLLNYAARYKVTDATGKDWIPPSAVKLQREYVFDRLNVLASEKEQDYLQREMRRDAAEQIVRRLAFVTRPASPAAAPLPPTPASP